MIVLYHAHIKKRWNDTSPMEELSLLPAAEGERIRSYRSPADRQLRMTGRLMLQALLGAFRLDRGLSLADIAYTKHGRPYFPGSGLRFSIAHSGDCVICAGTMDGQVGVDLELSTGRHLSYLKEFFTAGEWRMIRESADPAATGARLWTRKEAVIKATGTGVVEDIASIDSLAAPVPAGGRLWYLHTLTVAAGYECSLATDIQDAVITERAFPEV